jgi:hypothetical protein
MIVRYGIPYDSEFARVEAACRSQLEAVPIPRNRSLDTISSTKRSVFDDSIVALSVSMTQSIR